MFGIRVNIAIFLFVLLIGFILPLILVPILLSIPALLTNEQNLVIASSIVGLIFGFAGDYIVFKMTYKNAKGQDKTLELNSAVIGTIGVSAILYVLLYFFNAKSSDLTWNIIRQVAGFAVAALAFHLAGQKADKELAASPPPAKTAPPASL